MRACLYIMAWWAFEKYAKPETFGDFENFYFFMGLLLAVLSDADEFIGIIRDWMGDE